jgi:5'-methylthioadenosine phosphorylase
MSNPTAQIGIFGGSGFYEFAETEIREVEIETPYGPPSDKIALTRIEGFDVAFLPRHGRHHTLPPHRIPYRANLWAFKELGVTRVIAPTAVGSLQAGVKPGDFVVTDQFVDRTSGRADTFYDGPEVVHVSTAEPYCPHLRRLAASAVAENGIPLHDGGACVVIQGPRFSTKAESRWFTDMGWSVINMTQYPEVALARELAMCYLNIALVTDYDAGVVVDEGPVQAVNVLQVLQQNTANVKAVIRSLLAALPQERLCECAEALKFATISHP